MIKNGARLLRARRAAAEGKRRTGEQQATSRYSLHHQLLDQQLPLPPAFLLPAWSSAAVEKTVARGASSSRQSTTRRHASSYAHAELTRSHDGYTPDWLAGDVCEASAAASTSKALPVLQASTSVQPASRSSKAAMSVDTPSASAKGKLSDLQAASSDLPVASPKPGRTTSKNLAEAVEDAQIYLKQESTLSDPQGSTLSFKTILQLDLPVAILPLELQRTLIHPTDPTALQRDIPLTTAETLKASEHLNIRYNLACRILNAVLSRSTGQSRLLASERASVAHVLQDLVFLKANSISAILDSLPVSRGSDRAMYKGLPRIVKDALLAYMYRDTREQSSHVSSSTHSTISTSSGFQDSQLRQDFLVNHIRHSTRRLRRLPSSQLASFVSCHLDLFKDLSQSLQIEDSSTPSSVLQILQCISGLDIGKVHPIQPEQTLHSVLEMFAIPLKHVCSPSRKASNSTDSLFVRKLENSLLRAWHSSVMPLLKLQSAHSSLPETLLCAVQNLQHLAVQTQLAELSIRVALDVYDANRLLDKPHKSAWAFSLEQWNSIIAMCLRTGHNEQAEALLQRMSEVLQHQKQDGDSSMYWHLRLRAILRSDLSNSPAFFMRLDKLLKQIQRAGSRPDHHFLSTLLRHIPKFPASLDKACDLFHAALSLAQKEIVSHKSQAFSNTETSGLQLAASHGDLVLFERGKLEAVQLPWTPILAENPGRSLQSASTLTTNPSLDNELTQATLSSQQVRFALLRGELTEAVSAFQHMTHVIESIATPASGSSNWSDAGNAAYKTMQTMWIGLFVRLLSASLQRQDLSTSTNLVNLALDCLGSRWVGQQAMKRLFLAACSPKFHDQPHTLLRRRMSAAHVIHQQSFTRVLWTLRRWSEDMHANGSKPLALVVDEDMTSKQRMRSVLSRDTSSRILARATAMCLVPAMFANEAREAWPGAPQIYDSLDPIEVVQDVLSTMVALQVNCNFVKWWQRVERDVEEHMDAWSVPLHQRAGWRDKSNILAEMCAQMEAERLERTQVSRS